MPRADPNCECGKPVYVSPMTLAEVSGDRLLKSERVRIAIDDIQCW